MKVAVIVAMAENGVIGKDNTLIWRLSEDLKLFKKRTSGHAVIMGRKTFESIGKALPNRTNIILSKSSSFLPEGCIVVNTWEMAMLIASGESDAQEVFVIGGEMIYNLVADKADILYLTRVHATPEGDAFFDFEPYKNWELKETLFFKADEKNQYDFSVETWHKPNTKIMEELLVQEHVN
jgi:dihydrofolate reductase